MRLREIWSWIKEHKKGILFGAIVGAGIYIFSSANGTPLFSVDAPSVSDNIFTIATKWKYLIALVIVGAGAGTITENLARKR